MPPSRQSLTAPGAPAPAGPYVHAVRTGDLLFCAGQIPLHPETGELVGETPGEQARQCLENLEAVCAAAGGRLADAVRMTVYLTDIAAMPEVNEVYAELLGDDPPARVGIAVAGLPRGSQVEVDAIVAL